jgi:redox-sensitive bicupin YhaK (pirin superfamily)
MIEVNDSHEATVGRFTVRRSLPRRGRRTVGAWCFADHMGPADVTEQQGLGIGPHPHIGIQTATWLLDGQVLHRDSLGSEQVIAAGQLNLMTAGHAVSHSEEATGHYRGTLEGIQLWIAQPEATRHGEAGFAHHADLPQVEHDGCVATVFVGEHADAVSPARCATAIVGVDLDLHSASTVPLRPEFEYALIGMRGSIAVDGEKVTPGRIAYLGPGRDELGIEVAEDSRVMLLGGQPFEDTLLMWWNFVARTREEIDAAYASWRDGDERFGHVRSPLDRIPTGPPYWH